MKKLIIIIQLALATFSVKAQVTLDDFGRIVLNTYLPEGLQLPAEAKSQLQTKLNQITSNNGMGGSQVNPRFIITANVIVGTKDIVAGPPQMIAQNLDLVLFVGDALSNTIFSNITISLNGVGTNENKALIEAFKNINPKNKEIAAFLEEGKNKIISHYSSQCDIILKQANALAEQHKFDESIYALMIVPETCKDCYFRSKDMAFEIFKKKTESECTEKLKKAKLEWAAESNSVGAEKAARILMTITPSDNCRTELNKLVGEIKKKMQEDQKKQYDFDMLDMKLRYDTEQKRIDANKEIALELARNQPTTHSYTHIYWR